MKRTQDYIGKHVMEMTDEERVQATTGLPLLSIAEFGLLRRRMWMRWSGAEYPRSRPAMLQSVKTRKKQLNDARILKREKYNGVL